MGKFRKDAINYLAVRALFHLAQTGTKEITTRGIYGEVKKIRPNINIATVTPVVTRDFPEAGLTTDSGGRIGNSRIFTIIAKPEDMLDKFYGKDAEFIDGLPGEDEPADHNALPEQADDEISALEFGNRMIITFNALKKDSLRLEAVERELVPSLKRTVRKYEGEIKKLHGIIQTLKDDAKGLIPRSKLIEQVNENKRLKDRLDEQNKQILAMNKVKGKTFKLDELAHGKQEQR